MAEKLKSDRITIVALTKTTKIVIEEQQRKTEGRSELQLLCRYNSCKAVADNGEGWKITDYEEVKINELDSVDSRIRKGFGTGTFILLYKLLASCHVLN